MKKVIFLFIALVIVFLVVYYWFSPVKEFYGGGGHGGGGHGYIGGGGHGYRGGGRGWNYAGYGGALAVSPLFLDNYPYYYPYVDPIYVETPTQAPQKTFLQWLFSL
jgi:hypothetical protein